MKKRKKIIGILLGLVVLPMTVYSSEEYAACEILVLIQGTGNTYLDTYCGNTVEEAQQNSYAPNLCSPVDGKVDSSDCLNKEDLED